MSASKPRKTAVGAPKKLKRTKYDAESATLQAELVALQEWVSRRHVRSTIPATRTVPPAKEALMSRTRHDGKRAPRILTAVLGCLVLASCASPTPAPPASSPVPTTAATYSTQLCSAAADYQNAANAVVHLDASSAGIDGVKAALQDLQTAAQNLATAAKEQFSPQVAELEAAGASLRTTLAGLSGEDTLSTNLGKIAASVGAVEQAAKPIVDSVRTGCPSVPSAELPPAS
jgi:hypothetical protein